MIRKLTTLTLVFISSVYMNEKVAAAEIINAAFPLDPSGYVKENTSYGAHGDAPKYEDQYEADKTHIGIDYKAPSKTRVLAPVNGTIVFNKGTTKAEENVVVIRDVDTGYDHVLGHIECSVCKGKKGAFTGIKVSAGVPMGTVMDYPYKGVYGTDQGDHLHYGVNTKGIVDSEGNISGWGRISGTNRELNLAEASRLGWVDIDTTVKFTVPILGALVSSNAGLTCRSLTNTNAGMSGPSCSSGWAQRNQGRIPNTRQVDPDGNF